MSDPTVKASQAGVDAIRKAMKRNGWKQREVVEEVAFSRSTLNQILSRQPVRLENIEELCHLFDLQVGQVLEPENLADVSKLDSLVQTFRDRIRPIIQQRCGTMRVLNMTQPISLDKIYTHVNILEKITGHRDPRELAELLQEVSPEKFERFSLGDIKKERVPGLEAVEKHRKLMILGKPGAGKTTFLKHLAMQCMGGRFQGDCVPIFITLKDFAEETTPDFLTYINSLPIDSTKVEELQIILENGRALILLDGLDEVRETDAKRVLRQIQQFSERNASNAFVITCRIAAREYTFVQFTDVEVADFDDAQIADVSGKWFHCKQEEVKVERFLQKLKESPPIRELASSPLLLTLLCLVFESSGDFPAKRWKLYRDGLKTLLKRRSEIADTVSEPFYKALSPNGREKLFRKMALQTFEQGNYFFDVDVAERLLKQILPTCLSQKNADLDIDDLESDRFLAAIESQHGIIIERAHEVYSFAHLTFHEYFAAWEIKEKSYFNLLSEHLTDKRWREVTLLTVGMLPNDNVCLLQMKQAVDELMAGDEKLQRFLTWLDEKARSVDASYKPVAIRTFYFCLDLSLDFFLSFSLSLSLNLDFCLYISLSLPRARNLDREFFLNTSREAVDRSDPELKLKLDILYNQPPNSQETEELRKQWWQENGQAWTNQLRAVMIEHRNIGHDWQFNDAQKERLRQYYDANKLLVDCLNSDCYISRSVREEIEATLLLPI
jgi:predicted NACHT family NTPase